MFLYPNSGQNKLNPFQSIFHFYTLRKHQKILSNIGWKLVNKKEEELTPIYIGEKNVLSRRACGRAATTKLFS